MTRLTDAEGRELDADFDIVPQVHGADIVLHARQGSPATASSKNVDYFAALEAILAGVGRVDARILKISVDSVVARRLPPEQRVIPLDYPIRPAAEPDLAALRKRVTEGQRKIAVTVDAGAGHRGNNHKRIRLAVDLRTQGTSLYRLSTALRTHGRSPDNEQRTYRPAAANPAHASTRLFTFDPALRERGLSAHIDTQNALAEHLLQTGRSPFSSTPREPDYDLAWLAGDTFHVVEVKSLTGQNATQQMRLGLGQVLHYRAQLQLQRERVKAVLAVEHPPDPVWLEVCRAVEVTITWPPMWAGIDPAD